MQWELWHYFYMQNASSNFLYTKSNSTTTLQSVEQISCKIKPDGRFKNILAADKAYTSRLIKQELQEAKVSLITPNKRNAIRRQIFTPEEKMALKDRVSVEHFFCRMKKFKKLKVRYERSIASFSTFFYLEASYITFELVRSILG
jgi:hypothetical protein